MATTRFTLGAVLNTVSESAAMLTNTVVTLNTAVGMANAFVTKAAANQQTRYIREAANTKHQIASELAMEMTSREDAVIAYCNGDQAKQKRYNDHLDSLLALVNTTKP